MGATWKAGEPMLLNQSQPRPVWACVVVLPEVEHWAASAAALRAFSWPITLSCVCGVGLGRWTCASRLLCSMHELRSCSLSPAGWRAPAKARRRS